MDRSRLPLRLLVSPDVRRAAGVVPVVPQPRSITRVVARRKDTLVFLAPAEIWAFQAAGRLTFVHAQQGQFDLDISLTEIEQGFCRPLLRVHRNWLVDPTHVRQLERRSGQASLFVGTGLGEEGEGLRVPVARERSHAVREELLANAMGLRHTRPVASADASEDDD
jgi:DNA-binding LytR/AlgR family response regulator